MCNYHPKKSGRHWAFYRVLFSLSLLLVSGCGSKNSPPVENTDSLGLNAAVVREEVLKSLRNSQVTARLYTNEVAFDKELLHDVSHTDHYLRRGNKGAAAANLGVYLSDLSQLMALNKRDEEGRYFEACLRLSEFIGMKKQFSQAIQFGFNEIIAGDEKLKTSLEKRFKDASNTGQEEEFKKFHAAALTGYYIEELYHLASFIQSYNTLTNKDSVFFAGVRVFIDQKDELNNLITYFDHIKLKSEGISAYQDLLTLQSKYLALDSNRLLRETDFSILLQDKNLQDIFDSLFSFRKRIVDF